MTDRPKRADARRNRERLLDVAVLAFSRAGADVSMDAIAKEAGVGSGTLYRHFPSREALVEAVYRNELARLCNSAGELLAAATPEVALREWMGRFITYLTTKHGMAGALHAVIAAGGNPHEGSRTRVLDAITRLVEAGVASGTIRADVEPFDIMTSLSGVSLAAVDPAQNERLLDLLMDGLRYRA